MEEEAPEPGFMTYIEYKAHCYRQHRRPLPREVTGPIVYKERVQYAAKRPTENLGEIFGLLSDADGHITRRSLHAALERVRMPLKDHFKLFDLLRMETMDFEAFCAIFG